MTSAQLSPVPPSHPLRDRERLDSVIRAVELTVQKVTGCRRDQIIARGRQRADIVQQVVLEVLRYQPPAGQRLDEVNWEGLATDRARKRAIDAIRAARRDRALLEKAAYRGRVGDEGTEDESDALAQLPDDQAPDEDDHVDALVEVEQARWLNGAAQNLLDNRELTILHLTWAGETRTAIAADLSLTPQRVSQILFKTHEKLRERLKDDPEARRLMNFPDGGENE